MKLKSLLEHNVYLQTYGRAIGVVAVGLICGAAMLVNTAFHIYVTRTLTATKPIAYQTTTNDNCSLPLGTTKVTTSGVDGVETVTYKVDYLLGREVSRHTLADKTTMQPKAQVMDSGMKGTVSCANQAKIECDLTNISTLEAAGKTFTQQQYDAYVEMMRSNGCGPPQPYCTFNLTCFSTPYVAPSSSGFDAGYAYGEQYQICDTGYSSGNSSDFNAGVQAWAAANCTDGQPN